MPNDSSKLVESNRVLLCVAAPKDCRAVLDGLDANDVEVPEPWQLIRIGERFDLVHTGVGKSNAAGATAAVLDPSVHGLVLSVGIAGALPGVGVELLDVVVARHSVFGDEGIGADDGFIPMDRAGFGAFPDGTMGVDHDHALVEQLGKFAQWRSHIATVSWCSGSDACAQGVIDRTGAICEAMEGAAVALSAKRIAPEILTGEVRVISNTTGDRKSQKWMLDESLAKLSEVLGRVADVLG